MIVIMQQLAGASPTDAVVRRIEEAGFGAHVFKGAERDVIAVQGEGDLRALGDGATLLAEQWNAVGLKCQVKSVSFDELLGKRFLHDKIVANYWLRQHYSTILPFLYMSDGPFNESRLKDPKIDSLIGELQRTPLNAGGEDLLREVITRYNNEASSIWPFHMKEVWAAKKRVQNLTITPTEQVDMRNVFVA